MAVYDDPITHFVSMGQLQRIASDVTLTLARYLRSENFADFVIDQVSNTDGTPLDLDFDFVETYYIGNLTPMIVAAYGAAQAFAPEIDFA
mmetsp:Transcript_2952/g.390  ORF Transcript_2952/g.390 Transcript_2952/m.390 type:complete len:90 (+) Transcript_2952:78-347(+)